MNHSSQWSRIGTILKKELRETFRDRRALFSILFTPILAAGLITFMVHRLNDRNKDSEETVLHIKGAQHAPALVEAIKRAELTVENAPEDPSQGLKDGSIAAVLTIPESYDQDLAKAVPVPLEIRGDLTNTRSARVVQRSATAIRVYGATIASLRLAARGVAMRITRSFDLQSINLATEKQRASILTQIMLAFALLSVAVGAMYSCIDATAGERERKSLEPLLMTPTSTLALATGKWLAATVMSVLTCAVTLLILRQSFEFMPLESLDVDVSLDFMQLGAILGCLVPLAMLMSSAQLVLATFARSYREAQTYLSTFMMLPMTPAYLYDHESGAPELWAYATPALGQYLQSYATLRGEALEPLQILAGFALCVPLSAIFVFWLSRLLKREKIIYGR